MLIRIPAALLQLKFPGFLKKLLGSLCNIQECSRMCCIMLSRVIPDWFMNIRIASCGCYLVSLVQCKVYATEYKYSTLQGSDDVPRALLINRQMLQWSPVNTDTKGTCNSVRIIRVSVLSGLSEKTLGTHVLSI